MGDAPDPEAPSNGTPSNGAPTGRPAGAGLAVEGLRARYLGVEVLACDALSIPPGQVTSVVGPNGAGKSTLLKCIVGLVRPVSGRVWLDGDPIESRRADVAYLPQRAALDWDFPARVRDVVALGRYPHRRLRRRTREDHRVIDAALAALELEDLQRRPVRALSGGQQQRVLFARALAQQADALLLDEPLDGVDAVSERIILDRLRELTRAGRTIVWVHHDLATVRAAADHVVVISGSVVAEGAPATALTPEVVERAYAGGKNRSAAGLLGEPAQGAHAGGDAAQGADAGGPAWA